MKELTDLKSCDAFLDEGADAEMFVMRHVAPNADVSASGVNNQKP